MLIQLKKEQLLTGMRCFKIFIKQFDWVVNVLYNCDCSDNELIINYLKDIDCPILFINDALDNLNTCNLNIGFTYSNCGLKTSVMVICKTSDQGQFYNTVVHECYHLISHITRNQNTSEETNATLIGDVVQQIYKKINKQLNFDQE